MLYVSKSGDDSTGTVDRMDLPYLTIGAALADASATDTVLVMPGSYAENVTVPSQVTLQGINSDWVVITQTQTLLAETIVTLRSASIVRDIQVSAAISVDAQIHICFSVTGTDNNLASIVNCRTTASSVGGTSGVMSVYDDSTGTTVDGSYLIDGCILMSSGRRGYFKEGAGTSKVRNTLFYTAGTNDSLCDIAAGTAEILNCNFIGGRFSILVGTAGNVFFSGGTFQTTSVGGAGRLRPLDQSQAQPLTTDHESGGIGLAVLGTTLATVNIQQTFNKSLVLFSCNINNGAVGIGADREVVFRLFKDGTEWDSGWRHNCHLEGDDEDITVNCWWIYEEDAEFDTCDLTVNATSDGSHVTASERRLVVST
jgi:hypothetical protein